MSAELGLLKHIPCPRGEACTTHHCLFRHAGDEARWPLADGVTEAGGGGGGGGGGSGSGDGAGSSDSHEGPRKRVKRDASPVSLHVSASAGAQDGSRKRTGSPPALRRKVAAGEASPTAAALAGPPRLAARQGAGSGQLARASGSKAASQTVTVATAATAVTTTRVAPSAARKPETLNPRHLGKAPAAHEIRFRLLKMLHAEFARLNGELRAQAGPGLKPLVLSDQELIWMALDLEENCAVTKSTIYSNTIKNRIMGYKRMALPQWTEEREKAREKEEQATGKQQGPAAATTTPPDPMAPIDTGLTPQEEVVFLKTHLLTPIGGLARHGYVPAVPSEADIQKAREAADVSKGWEVCDRCATRFQVFPGRREQDGALTSGGACTYHPGKLYYPPKNPVGGGGGGGSVRRYRCCGQAVGDSPGCATSASHVFKTSDPKRLALLWNFAATPANAHAPAAADAAVCFDCEMGYTVYGLELIRLTATAWPGGAELLDVLVRPLGAVIDLNSRYSGVWPEDMANALPFSAETVFGTIEVKEGRRRLQMVSSPEVARDLLFSLVRPDTPLIGHGLENDLNSMRIVHPTICDTILLYPHPKGLPARYGLKMLVDRHLHRQIQAEPPEGVPGQLAGHDSAEDARAAGDLVRFRIKQDWATKRMDGWAFRDGRLVEPGKTAGLLTESYIEKDD